MLLSFRPIVLVKCYALVPSGQLEFGTRVLGSLIRFAWCSSGFCHCFTIIIHIGNMIFTNSLFSAMTYLPDAGGVKLDCLNLNFSIYRSIISGPEETTWPEITNITRWRNDRSLQKSQFDKRKSIKGSEMRLPAFLANYLATLLS
jgi:hypothetical protein